MGKLAKNRTDQIRYDFLDDRNIFFLIQKVREGIRYSTFTEMVDNIRFSISEWSKILHLSERTFQRYRVEKKKFTPIHSEKIVQIILLYDRGTEVFGDSDKFNNWLNTKNVALGGTVPKNLLDNTFGIRMIFDELDKIEHGTLA